MVMVTGSPSGPVMPTMRTGTSLWFGGQSSGTAARLEDRAAGRRRRDELGWGVGGRTDDDLLPAGQSEDLAPRVNVHHLEPSGDGEDGVVEVPIHVGVGDSQPRPERRHGDAVL